MKKIIETWQERAAVSTKEVNDMPPPARYFMEEVINEQAAYIAELESRLAAPVVAEGLTDEQIEAHFKARGGSWDGNRWTIEDADLHPFVRSLAAHPVAGSPAEAINWKGIIENVVSYHKNGIYDSDRAMSKLRRSLEDFATEPMPASEAAKQTLPQRECNAALRAAPAVPDLPQLPTQPEELRARWKCEDCDGRGHDGELHGGDYFQPPEPGRCTSCDGSGHHETAALLPEQAAEYGKACFEAGARFRAEGGNTNDSAVRLAAPAAPTDAKPAADLTDVLTTMLWLYRRLPRAYGRSPLSERAITALANQLGEEVENFFSERDAAQSVRDAAQPTAAPGKEA